MVQSEFKPCKWINYINISYLLHFVTLNLLAWFLLFNYILWIHFCYFIMMYFIVIKNFCQIFLQHTSKVNKNYGLWNKILNTQDSHEIKCLHKCSRQTKQRKTLFKTCIHCGFVLLEQWVHVQQVVLDGRTSDRPASASPQVTDRHGGLYFWVFDVVAFIKNNAGPGHPH